ncbi:ComF family protein [Altererythrobacter sp. Z27]|uniref:ComF family protein n=1 Tax=Altererythrobacter sp. Z27 TaxID=3461147 RepID=UPI004044597B
MGRAEKFSASFSRVFAPLIDLVYPPRCPLCGVAIAENGGLCGSCWAELVIPGEPACASCSRPFPPGIAGGTTQCAVCLHDPPRHAGIAAATLYNDASRRLILAYKHGRKIALAGQLGRLMAAKLPEPGEVPPLLVPVPLHRWRLWRRGFNQAALLAHELTRHGKGELAVDALVRRKATPMLGGMRRKARQRALSGAIEVPRRRAELVRGRDVILVDDVLTSGATTSACITALQKAGAVTVKICCFSRVLDESLHGDAAAAVTMRARKT